MGVFDLWCSNYRYMSIIWPVFQLRNTSSTVAIHKKLFNQLHLIVVVFSWPVSRIQQSITEILPGRLLNNLPASATHFLYA